jgi:ribosomal protein S12 methylthiotransferase accessory factor
LDIGIPTVGVLAYDPTTFPEKSEIVWTAGTTPGAEKALSRALTETAQLAGDFNSGSNYVASGLPKFTAIEDAAYITHPDKKINIGQLPDISHDNIKIEVENCIAALARKKMEVIVVDTMHPQLRLPAFYTLIPGSHFRERALGTGVGMFSAKLIAEKLPPQTAIMELKQIDNILKGKYYIKFYIGLCHISLENYKEALAHLNEALDLDPNPQDIPSIYSYMGVCLKEMGEYRNALEVLEKGLSYDQDRTDIHNLMGFCHYMLKEHEKAIDCFGEVIRLDPGSAIDYANIASNYREMGQIDKAVIYYQTALTIDPTIDFARENLEKLTMKT